MFFWQRIAVAGGASGLSKQHKSHAVMKDTDTKTTYKICSHIASSFSFCPVFQETAGYLQTRQKCPALEGGAVHGVLFALLYNKEN